MTKPPTSPEPPGSPMLSPLTTREELSLLKELERSGSRAELDRALTALDKKQSVRALRSFQAVDPRVVNQGAIRIDDGGGGAVLHEEPHLRRDSSLLANLFEQHELGCDCVEAFSFAAVKAYGAMTGPSPLGDVRGGWLGARRLAPGEYEVVNPGSADSGTTRVPLGGQIYITLLGHLPADGRNYLLMPAAKLQISGSTRVVGHGNSTTSYDAKAWVRFYSLLRMDGAATVIECTGGEVHYDGTRSEDRTKSFSSVVTFEPRYFGIDGNAGDRALWELRLEVTTEANEHGIATVAVDVFGFPASTKSDYDMIIVKGS